MKKKPAETWESFIERRIREAQAQGEFDRLPGFGQPIPDIDEPWDENTPGRWYVAPEVTAEELVERLRAIGDRTRSVLRDFPMTATASPGGRFADDPPSLEWICFHVLAEYARHAGHLDVAVELATDDQAPK